MIACRPWTGVARQTVACGQAIAKDETGPQCGLSPDPHRQQEPDR